MKLVTMFFLAVMAFAHYDIPDKDRHPGQSIPEPSTIVLLGLGLAGLIAFRPKKK